jgi:hypothetical protein
VVAIEDSTLARAGDAATRLALEETLLRRGWRVLFLDDQFGPLFGPQRPKLFDGIAVRLRPGSADKVELRLVHMESDTLEASSELVERVKKAARSATVEWLVAAFDGESMRVVPELNEIESVAARAASPSPEATAAPLLSRRASPPPPPAAAVTPQRRPNAQPTPAAATRDMTTTAASRRRRPSRSRPADAPAGVGATPGGRPPSRASTGADQAPAGNRRGGTSSGARPGGESAAAAAQGQSASAPAGAKRSRRRGKRGGRRRSGRPAAS